MKNEEVLSRLSKDELIQLIEMYSKNLVALDGLWFPCATKNRYLLDIFVKCKSARNFFLLESVKGQFLCQDAVCQLILSYGNICGIIITKMGKSHSKTGKSVMEPKMTVFVCLRERGVVWKA